MKAVGAELLQLSRQADAAAPAENGNVAQQGQQQAGQQAQQVQRPAAVDSGSFLANVGRHTGKTIDGGVLLDDAWATNQATTFLVAGEQRGEGAAAAGWSSGRCSAHHRAEACWCD